MRVALYRAMKPARLCLDCNAVTAHGSRCQPCSSALRARTRAGNGWQMGRLREAVLARDGHACVVCGSRDRVEADHIVQARHGGQATMGNMRTLCWRHHRVERTG